MTPKCFIAVCKNCSATFIKDWTHQAYCSVRCAVWGRIEQRGVDDCWPWIGGTNDRGYGQISIRKQRIYVHRLACAEAHGASPMNVLHSCDNPRCCNPAHLRWGTQKDNVKDAITRGRAVLPAVGKGEKCPRAKITEREVREIRARAAAAIPRKSLQAEYGLSKGAICNIIGRRIWRHVA